MKHKKGLTLMELTIVLAIMAIIVAVAVPMFLLTTDSARLRADIQSARVIQNAMELYVAERGLTVLMDSTNMADIVPHLALEGYLRNRNTTPQTAAGDWNATWVRTQPTGGERLVRLSIADAPEAIQDAFSRLTEDEQSYVVGGILSP